MTDTDQVKEAMLRCIWTYTRSETLVKECSDIFDAKKRPQPVVDNKLRLVG